MASEVGGLASRLWALGRQLGNILEFGHCRRHVISGWVWEVGSKVAAKREKKRPESSVETTGRGEGSLSAKGWSGRLCCPCPARLQLATYPPAPGSGHMAATLMAFLKLRDQ
ncbi:hypothetical protein HispidOSU_003350, partial [Sigmodon hispidus]